ncbi:cytochrome c oxidase assembly factor 5 [Copidosoma floridanum]|uniref:cytochrome c oxidase assembly factor 5 n=1 Tax=Copidosoma floridanum TaxID=29053 RepID=UPI000C6FB34B|nr:cytochrome c oxidase assembly factor 5 [Copidosoma floridanum]
MPAMDYTEPNERLKDQSRCANLRAELKMCLLKSDCCKHKHTPRDCLKHYSDTIPHECNLLRYSFFECKRSLIDARRRFRGPRQ